MRQKEIDGVSIFLIFESFSDYEFTREIEAKYKVINNGENREILLQHFKLGTSVYHNQARTSISPY